MSPRCEKPIDHRPFPDPDDKSPYLHFNPDPTINSCRDIPQYIHYPERYSEILNHALAHCDAKLEYEYMRGILRKLLEQNSRIAYLYDLIIYLASIYDCDENKYEPSSVQDDFDAYSKSRIKAIRLIRLLHTPTEYDQSYLKKDLSDLPETNAKLIESFEEICQILRAFAQSPIHPA